MTDPDDLDLIEEHANTTCPRCGHYVPRDTDGRLEAHQAWSDGQAGECG